MSYRYGLGFILIGQLIAALYFAISMPLWERSDEMNHYRYAYFIAMNNRLPSETDWPIVPEGYEIYIQYNQPPFYYLLLSLPIRLLDDNSLEDVTANPFPLCDITHDFFYLHTNAAQIVKSGTSQAAWIGRLFSIFIGLITTVLVWLGGRWLAPQNPTIALVAATIIAWTPGFLEFTTWINNDTPLLLSGALLVCGIIRLQNKLDVIALALVLSGTILSLLIKLTGLAVVPVVAWLLFMRFRRGQILMSLIIIGLMIGLFGMINTSYCGHPVCRLHRYTSHFQTIDELLHTLTRADIYTNAVLHLVQTTTSPTAGDQKHEHFFTSAVVGGILLLGLMRSFFWQDRIRRCLSLFVLSALILAALRVWWLQVGYVHIRYLAVALPALSLLVAIGWSQMPNILSAVAAAALWLITMSVPLFVYTPIYEQAATLDTLPNEAVEIDGIVFDDAIQARAYQWIEDSEGFRLRIFWQSIKPINEPVYAVITFLNKHDEIVNYCGMLAGHPMQQTSVDWLEGEYIVQDFPFYKESGEDAVFSVMIQLYQIQSYAYIVSTIDPENALSFENNTIYLRREE